VGDDSRAGATDPECDQDLGTPADCIARETDLHTQEDLYPREGPTLPAARAAQAAVHRPRRAARPLSAHRFRWVFQLFFLLLFLALLTLTFWPVFSGLVSGFLLADPLIALNSAARGLFRWEMLLAIPVFLSPLFLGRVFCGYACPMGFLIELFGPKKERHPGPGARKVLRRVPLFGLVVVMMLMLVGSAWFLVMDPISLLTRSATTLLYPAVNQVLTWAGDALYRVDAFQGGVDSVTNFLTGRLIFPDGLHFALQIVILVMFVAIIGIAWIERRLWCRHLCPLGALLGLMGRYALFGRTVDAAACTNCRACERACPMDAIRDDGLSTDMSRCECGLECADSCRQGAIRWGYRPRKHYEYDPSRRALLVGAAVAFAGSFALFRGFRALQAPAAAQGADAAGAATLAGPGTLIRPPGAQAEANLLASCARCDECLKVCPTNVLQPAAFEAGLVGMFTPRLDFTRAYCEWTCAECGKVCPTQSIAKLDLPTKQQAVIGVAVIDRKLCLPWAKNTECLVCEELCPIPQKAVVFVGDSRGGGGGAGGNGAGGAGAGAEYTTPEDAAIIAAAAASGLKLPRVLERHCTGCGICQFNCPVQGPAAIVVHQLANGPPSPATDSSLPKPVGSL
jgi:polyferredoxin